MKLLRITQFEKSFMMYFACCLDVFEAASFELIAVLPLQTGASSENVFVKALTIQAVPPQASG